jgi:hypothetical protein
VEYRDLHNKTVFIADTNLCILCLTGFPWLEDAASYESHEFKSMFAA